MTCEENKRKHVLCTQVHIQIVNIFYAIHTQMKNTIYAMTERKDVKHHMLYAACPNHVYAAHPS